MEQILKEIELQDCPLCRGTGALEEEGGWCFYVSCLDCGAHTAEIPYKTKEERLTADRIPVSEHERRQDHGHAPDCL